MLELHCLLLKKKLTTWNTSLNKDVTKLFSKNYLKIINSLLHSRVDKKSKKKFIMIRSYSPIKFTHYNISYIPHIFADTCISVNCEQ